MVDAKSTGSRPMDQGETVRTPFSDMQAYLDLPRLTGLVLSPDGSWNA